MDRVDLDIIMGAIAIGRLRQAGFQLEVDGEQLRVRPASQLTAEHRRLVEAFTAPIIEVLGVLAAHLPASAAGVH